MDAQKGEITLGPVLFNWPPERWRDFYFRIADEAPVSTVYVGEAICSKRDPLFEPHFADVGERLTAAGKTVVFSTLAQVVLKHDRALVKHTCACRAFLVEANDGSALAYLRGRPHHIGPFMNVYNERTAAFLAGKGACNICLPPEMPVAAVAAFCDAARNLRITIEVQVFGRVPLALSARCYHARAHGRTKDSCQYVCENDPDGMVLKTLDAQPFLAVNGIQTLSYDYLNLVSELPYLRKIGVSRIRLSPQDCDMVKVATTFRAVLDRSMDVQDAVAQLAAMNIDAPFSNGFYYGKPGYSWTAPTTH